MNYLSDTTNKELKSILRGLPKKTISSLTEFIELVAKDKDYDSAIKLCSNNKYNAEFNRSAHNAMLHLIGNKEIEFNKINFLFEKYDFALDTFADELEMLVEYLEEKSEQTGGSHPFPEIFVIFKSVIGGGFNLELGFQTTASAAIWSRVPIDINESALFSIASHITGRRMERENGDPITFMTFFDIEKESHAPTPCPLFKYHPERFKQSRTYSKHAFDPTFRREMVEGGLYTSLDSMQMLAGEIIQEYNNKNSTIPLNERLEHSPNTNQLIGDEMELFTQIAHFLQAGKQIFDINKGLVELFKDSDVDDIPLECIKLPYEAIYLHFGKQDIEMSDGWFFEGSYVSYQEDTDILKITITSIHDDITTNLDWTRGDITTYTVTIPKASSKKDLALAITEAMAQKINDLNVGLIELDEKIEFEGATIINASHQNKEAKLLSIKKRHDAFQKAVILIVNSICYLSAYSKDRALIWPKRTPEKLVKQVKSKNKKEASAARKKLFELGYTKVYSINPTEEQSRVIEGRADGSVHWRRSHWKTQPHGPKSMLRKLIWIMPTLVNRKGEEDEDDVKGHIYITKQ